MFDVLLCIRDQHDWRLIVLAGVICAAATATAVPLLRHALRVVKDKQRWMLIAGAAFALGVWATHFVAMLGYDPGVVIGYHLGLTGISLVLAILLISAGFAVALRGAQIARWTGAALIGGGISAMHYTGMNAVTMPGVIQWNWTYIVASIVLSIAPVVPALKLALIHRSVRSAAAASVLLALAVLLLHFTGMTAATIVPMAVEARHGVLLTPITMGVTISATATTVMLLCVGAALFSHRAQAAINAREHEFSVLVQGITDCAIYMLDTKGHVANWNAGASYLKGYTAKEIIGTSFAQFYSEEDQAKGIPQRGLDMAKADGKFYAEGWRYRKDGSRFWAHVTLEKFVDDTGLFRGFAKVTRDMTHHKQQQEHLTRLTRELDGALSNMHQGLCMFDAKENLVMFNTRVSEMFKLPPSATPVGTPFKQILSLALQQRAGGGIPDSMLEEVYGRHIACVRQPNGGTMIVNFTADFILAIAHRPMPNGGWVSTFEDITEERRSQAKMAHMALHDSLTGLANRAYYNEQLDRAMENARRTGRHVGVVVIDIDGFKQINDARGHTDGDRALKMLAERMTAALGNEEVVARIGGDEFGAFKIYQDAEELADFAARLESRLKTHLKIDSFVISLSASLGVASYPADGATRETVFNNADLAMARAKGTLNQQICYYEPSMDEGARKRRALANDMRDAVRRGEFSLAYQVQKSTLTQEITGFEALIRWQHPRLGMVSPMEFIPLAEETGEIVKIGEWVLRKACAEAVTWPGDYKVAVNLSPVQLMNLELADLVRDVLTQTGLPAHRLELEITETALVGDKARALLILRQIKMMGVTIAMDDFGTGYSSLDTLNAFPFDKIKIDKSFLIGSSTSTQALAIVRAILALGKSLNIPVLAEGLETEEQLTLLRTEGCMQAQGYLFGKPQLYAAFPDKVAVTVG